MKRFPFVIFVSCIVCIADIAASGQSVAQRGSPQPSGIGNGSSPYIPSNIGTNSLPSGLTFGSGTLTYIGGTATVPYGSGKHPNLQNALVDLSDALDNLNRAYSADKGDYLPRAIFAVQTAIADVKFTLDDDDGRPVPPVSSLPALPTGVGNPSSGLKVVPLANPKVSSPNMDAAIADLTKVQAEFNIAVKWTPPVYMARAVADVNFAMDNANAAVNAANGLPPSPALTDRNSAASAGSTTSGPDLSINLAEIIGAIVVVVVLIAIVVEQVWRAKGRG